MSNLNTPPPNPTTSGSGDSAGATSTFTEDDAARFNRSIASRRQARHLARLRHKISTHADKYEGESDLTNVPIPLGTLRAWRLYTIGASIALTPQPSIDIDDIMHPDERRRRSVRVCEASIAVLDQRIARIDEESERLSVLDELLDVADAVIGLKEEAK